VQNQKPEGTLRITDSRTNASYEIPIEQGAIAATELRRIKTGADDFGLLAYDPGFVNTASCKSTITFIDGDRGILWYRGYPIEQLAEHSTYLEVAYLLLHGELPSRPQLDAWLGDVGRHVTADATALRLLDAFDRGAHPMGVLMALVAALSTVHPEARAIHDAAVRRRQILRLLGGVLVLGASIHRHGRALPRVEPDPALGYCANFLRMLFGEPGKPYRPDPVLERAVEVLFILHADHEQNCSANAVRSVGSSEADPYSAVAAGIGALFGPLHGGANEAVLQMLRGIGSVKEVPDFIAKVKAGARRLMGFGHRVYKNYDPRAKLIKQLADQVFTVTGMNPLLRVAVELERIALEDDYFVNRKLYPNVDFYSGLIYEAMGFPADMFTVLFAIARTSGWLAQWQEMVEDAEQKIARPRQLYLGASRRDWVPLDARR
jgi:citrate synthase